MLLTSVVEQQFIDLAWAGYRPDGACLVPYEQYGVLVRATGRCMAA